MNARQFLTEQVRDFEHYIRSADISIKRGNYGDYDYAEWELTESAEMEDLLDQWDFDFDTPWFVALVKRQARCNVYASGDVPS